MAYEKIVTCCYCGTRAALVLMGDQKHCLACSSCGAPITQMKQLKKTRVQRCARGAIAGVISCTNPIKTPKAQEKETKSEKNL